MNPPPIASGAITSYLVFGSFVTLFIGALLMLVRRHSPLRQFAPFRVSSPPPSVRFDRLASASIGSTPDRQHYWRYTLSFALDSDWVYLRESRVIPFFPKFWRLPRKKIRPFEDEYWTLRITVVDPPLNADFGRDFVAALRGRKSR